MSMELSDVVYKALLRGYQFDPQAFAILSKLQSEHDVNAIVEEVIKRKESNADDKTIKEEDFGLVSAYGGEVRSGTAVVPTEVQSEVEVLSDPTNEIAPVDAGVGFRKLFQDRYERLLTIARRRPDSKNVVSLQTANRTSGKDRVRTAGLLSSRMGRKGIVELVLDDPSGTLKVICNDSEVVEAASEAPLDSMVVVEGSRSKSGRFYADVLTMPDIPSKRLAGASHRVYSILLSDLHIGSKMFLEDDFNRMVLWLNGKLGDADIVNRIKYVIIAGDIVDGIGAYPGQEFQLAEKNLNKQYEHAAKLIDAIPKHVQVFISPGNHDPVRQALPQPAVSREIAAPLYGIENVKSLGNPCYLKLNGVTFLIYHGRSLDDIIATIPNLSYDKPAAAMEVLLKARHLAPMYGKRTALAPEIRDMLIIDQVPDVFHSGHVHAVDVQQYRGTVLVNSGTWQSQTPFQANMGMEPTPSIVPIMDLSTLEVQMRSFTKHSFDSVTSG